MTQSSAEMLLDVFRRLRDLQNRQVEMTISIRALLLSMKEAFPNLAYDEHHLAASKSEEVQRLRASTRLLDANIEALRKLFAGEVD